MLLPQFRIFKSQNDGRLRNLILISAPIQKYVVDSSEQGKFAVYSQIFLHFLGLEKTYRYSKSEKN